MNKFIVKPNKTIEEINNERRENEKREMDERLRAYYEKRERELWDYLTKLRADQIRKREEQESKLSYKLPRLLGFGILCLFTIAPYTYVAYFVIAK